MIENGAHRYTMTSHELSEVYRKLENFVADCTTQEYIDNKGAINSVFSLIHVHMQHARREFLKGVIHKCAEQLKEMGMLDVKSRHDLLLAISELANIGSKETDELVEEGKELLKRRRYYE